MNSESNEEVKNQMEIGIEEKKNIVKSITFHGDFTFTIYENRITANCQIEVSYDAMMGQLDVSPSMKESLYKVKLHGDESVVENNRTREETQKEGKYIF